MLKHRSNSENILRIDIYHLTLYSTFLSQSHIFESYASETFFSWTTFCFQTIRVSPPAENLRLFETWEAFCALLIWKKSEILGCTVVPVKHRLAYIKSCKMYLLSLPSNLYHTSKLRFIRYNKLCVSSC